MDVSVLQEINTWWVTDKVPDSFLEPVPRKITPQILQAIEERQVILLEGPRRVGKTSIIFHLIQALIQKGISPKHILYVSLDDPLIGKEKFFEKLIALIETHLIGSRIASTKERFYLFLDELTYLKDWELYLKRYYDRKYPLKFIVSGSAASFLAGKGRETLVGRIFRFNVHPFSFSEFLQLKNAVPEVINHHQEVAALWTDFFRTPDAEALFRGLEQVSKNKALYQKEIDFILHQFLLQGGFPEFLQLKGEREVRQYFPENIIERVIYHDIPETFNVADRGLLQNLLLYSIFHSGSIININEIAGSFNAVRQTVSDYFHYLQASMLVRLLEKYAKTEASRLRAFRKLYTIDTGLYIYLQRLTAAQIEERGITGALAEIAAFSQLHSYMAPSGKIFYFRERQKEVDFVVEAPGVIVPVEVKYRKLPREISGLRYFMKKFGTRTAIVITKDILKLEKETVFVPLSLFLS